MVVDNERKILHARTKEAALKAYFLGMKGESPIEKLGQVDNLLDHHSPDKAASRTNKLSIVSISPLSSKLESNAHLVAVLSDCTRIYLSTSSSSQSSPNCLRVVTTPNLTIDQRKGLSTKAEIAYCPTLGNCELETGLSEEKLFQVSNCHKMFGDSTILSCTSRYVPSRFMRKRVNIESIRRQEAGMCDAIEKRKLAISKKIM
ncbi:hypothetical protein ARALYDRAFT_342249 [Arabidopsis lyrata subsp. lyrata]|uniref:Nucleoporin Nup133/Nup155-like N-terminal domain-containing protein n=1 Tax=Arabidopsis lyrata subsp. lyrata TaxID=81972 RepID=D7KZY5_ARALL|nr:hypothetical protein ARALYDRAFT_342249 [Arabidopsis lyrata subsp. lyrata]